MRISDWSSDVCSSDLDRAAGDARLVEIDQQIGDTVVLRGIGLGTHQHEHVRRLHALRRPYLLSVDDPLAAVRRQLAARADARQVRSRTGFRIALPPDIISLERFADE